MSEISSGDRELINKFKESHKWTCHYCNKSISSKDDLTVDHRIPLSRGGRTIETNLVICCVKCNTEKDNLTEEEYYLFKEKQLQLCEPLGFLNVINNLFSMYDQIVSSATIR